MLHRFGPFELDDRLFELRRNGVAVTITRKAFDVLAALLARQNEVVTKEELAAQIWPGVTVTKDSLAQAVMLAREALGDDAESPRFIVTVRGRGYRFVGDVGKAPAPAEKTDERPNELVARDAHLATLREKLASRGGTLLVTGEPGVGKTRLVENALAELRDATVITTRCKAADVEPSFWPVVRLLRALGDEAKAELLAGNASVLDDTKRRFALFEEALEPFRRVAQRGPLVVVFDDLHLADGPTLAFFDLLASHARALRCVVIGIHRTPAPNAFTTAIGSVRREATTTVLRLAPLTRAETSQWIAGILGAEPSERLVDKLFAKTAGNPLLLSQMSHVIRSHSHVRTAEMATSGLVADEAVRDEVTLRLAAAPPAIVAILRVAAVLGVRFALVSLATVLERSNEDVLRALDAAIAERLVAPGRAAGTFTFTIPLVRDVLVRQLAPSERAGLHRKAALALAARVGEADHALLGAVAEHYVAAAVLGDVDAAVRWSLRAAEAALASGARDAAATYARGGLSALGFAREAPDPTAHARLVSLAGG